MSLKSQIDNFKNKVDTGIDKVTDKVQTLKEAATPTVKTEVTGQTMGFIVVVIFIIYFLFKGKKRK